MTGLFPFVVGLWLAGVVFVFGCLQRRTLRRLWREPLLRFPVLIIESDDWGPGPPADAEVLQQLAEILRRHRDASDHPAVMTLGILLAVPDTGRMRKAAGREYLAAWIFEPQFAAIMAAIRRGMEAGVFSPQLHGMEHYWPDAVMNAAGSREEVRAWLLQDAVPRHEDLPPALQSRWIDASCLPSRALPEKDVTASALRETEAFRELFGIREPVIVPPTFIWSEAAEAAWSTAGARVVVTPGMRYSARDAEGKLVASGERLFNGETGSSQVMYLVRDDYFEPALGHRAERSLAALEAKTRTGRPMLLETHRFNFTGSSAQRENALCETDKLLRLALQRFPHLQLMSTTDLASAIARSDSALIERRLLPRIKAWLARAAQIRRLRRLAWLSGVIFPAWLLYRAVELGQKAALSRSG